MYRKERTLSEHGVTTRFKLHNKGNRNMNDRTNQRRKTKAAIMYLTDHLTKEWRVVGETLGMSSSAKYEIGHRWHDDPKRKTKEMLKHWMQTRGYQATVLDLTYALRKAGRADLADALEEGEHLAYVSEIHDVTSSVVKTNNKVWNQMMREANQHPKRRWYLVIVCIVVLVLGAYLIYPLGIRKHMDTNGGSTDTKAAYNFEWKAGEDGVLSAPPKRIERSSEWDTTLKSNYELLQSDHLENALRYVKNTLTKEWQDVGRYLGLSHADIEHINEQHKTNPKERNYQMLQKWREVYGNLASVEGLQDALRKARRRDLADNLYKEIRKQGTR